MMQTPMALLPPLAKDYVEFVSKKIGICGEVFLTCWSHYAELVEGLEPSPDKAYRADGEAFMFFRDKHVSAFREGALAALNFVANHRCTSKMVYTKERGAHEFIADTLLRERP